MSTASLKESNPLANYSQTAKVICLAESSTLFCSNKRTVRIPSKIVKLCAIPNLGFLRIIGKITANSQHGSHMDSFGLKITAMKYKRLSQVSSNSAWSDGRELFLHINISSIEGPEGMSCSELT